VIAARLLAVAVLGATALAAGAQAPEIERALRAGELQLAAGDVAGAEATFERAAAGAHESAIEASVVRVYLQRGDYRQALSFAAHAAGAHSDYPPAAALYAWLLHAGGQQQVARRLLDEAVAAAPADRIVAAASASLAAPWPIAAGVLLEPPVRFAPYARGAVARGAVVASATLIDGGRRALAPGGAIAADAAELWVRNGLGTTVRAVVERRFSLGDSELALLELHSALPLPENWAVAERAPFAGSVGYAVEFAAMPASAEAAWPLLRLGFFGRAPAATALPLLGIDLPPGPRGGAAFDEAGRLVGLALRSPDGRDRLVTVAALPEEARALLGELTPGGPTPRSAVDVVYERALRLTLQLIVASP
jgi:tetratricopeptide (TPR) repeat protein